MRTATRLLVGAAIIAAAGFLVREPARAAMAGRATPDYSDAFRDYVPYTGMTSTINAYSPTRNTSGVETYFGVNSKWQQPRSVGTTPHQGTDLNTPMGTPVHPIDRGWIVYQSSTAYELIIQLDWDYDNVQDDDVYVKYDHLQYVNFKPTGSFVTTADKVATSGSEGGTVPVHLHFGVLYPKFATGTNGRWAVTERLYTNVADWNYGRDLDFINYVEVAGSRVWANAYTKDNTQTVHLPAGNVRLYHRRVGATRWDSVTMTAASHGDWYADLPYPAGTQVQWLVQARRPMSGETHNSAYFPPRFKHPDNSPNVSATFPYFTATVQ